MTNETEAVRAVAWVVTSDDATVYCGDKATADAQAFELKRAGYPASVDPLYPASEIARLTGEISSLQKSLDQLTGMKFSDRMHAALVSRAEAAEFRVAEVLAGVDRKIEWRLKEMQRIGEVEIKTSLHMEHLNIHQVCLHDLSDIRRGLTQPEADHG